jgi:hypothetical protein
MAQPPIFLLGILVVVMTFVQPKGANAQTPIKIQNNLLELSSSRSAATRLERIQQVQYEQYPLGTALSEVAQAYGLSLWIDRRVDRNRSITFSGTGPGSQLVRGIAKAGGVEGGLIENIFYVGPTSEFAAVQRSAVRLHNEYMLNRKTKNAQLLNLVWEKLTTPAQLLAIIEKQWSVTVEAELPHDLMHANELAECTLATQLTLLCAGFGLQAQFSSEKALVTKPLQIETMWETLYEKSQLRTLRELNALMAEHPGARVESKNSPFVVTGPTNFHLAVLKNTAPQARRPNKAEPKFQIPKIYAPVSQIIEQLASKLSLRVDWSQAVPLTERQKPLTLHVTTDKTIAEILEMIASQSGLVIELNGDLIKISPAK